MDTSAIYFEDFHVGDTHTTYSRTMTETDIVLHADLGDVFPHHMDAEFAKTTEFGQRIAHGALTFSMAVGMKANTINTVGFSYGYDHLRFVKPVFIGDTIHVVVTITEKRDHPKRKDMGIVVEHMDVINQRGEVVLVCDHLTLNQRRVPRGETEA